MSSHEFHLIERYFTNLTVQGEDVVHGIGDDAAILSMPAGFQLAVSADTLVDEVHFPKTTDAYSVGYKSLAVNLSDMAAMGAIPRWACLCLTLPEVNEKWLSSFAEGFSDLAQQQEISLVGGDLSRGPLSITVQILGTVKTGQALTRSGAQLGDAIFVTGQLGCAAFALSKIHAAQDASPRWDDCVNRLNRPEPRNKVGSLLTGIASSAIDISDGLIGDLTHILKSSAVSATVELEKIPLCKKLRELDDNDERWRLAIASGDDYELCFTVPEPAMERLEELQASIDCSITRIGHIVDAAEPVSWILNDGQEYKMNFDAYRHFDEA